MPRVDLSGKPMAITGASSGIGAATALACARVGMPVALAARRTDRLAHLAEQIRSTGGRVLTMTLDVADPAGCEAFIERTVAEFGSIYSVYANAGYGLEATVAETTDKQMREIFEVNFFGTLNVIRPALRHMLAAKASPYRGHVLICSSCLGKMTVPLSGAYSATKAAQSHIGRAMRLEMEPKGVQVSVVHPIGTRTEFSRSIRTVTGGTRIKHVPDWFTQDASFVADCTVACLRRPRPEVWTGFMGRFVRFGMSLNTLFPGLADATTRKYIRKHLSP